MEAGNKYFWDFDYPSVLYVLSSEHYEDTDEILEFPACV